MAEQGTGHRQRLKERFLAGEPAAHGDEALLELLLSYAIPRVDVQPLARRLIAQFGSLRMALAAERSELARVHGLGDAAITLLKLADHLATMPDPAPHQLPAPPARAANTTTITPAPLPRGSTPPEDDGASETLALPDDGASETLALPGHAATAQRASFLPLPPGTPAKTRSLDPAAPPCPPTPEMQVDQAPAQAPARARTASRPRAPQTRREPRSPQPAPETAPATRWRATGRYSAANMLKPGMVAEIRLALDAYARLGDLAATRRYLQEEGLPQRSRATRNTIATVIGERLASWNPPRWVCADLIAAAAADLAGLKLLLLLHTARQDALLYAVIQGVVVPRWHAGLTAISHIEMQRFLDEAAPTHPEIHTWSRATRIKLAGNLLTVPRDYGLLVGAATKRIVEPVVSPAAAGHLARLLAEEGAAPERIADHPDWALWLLTPDRARALLAARDGSAP